MVIGPAKKKTVVRQEQKKRDLYNLYSERDAGFTQRQFGNPPLYKNTAFELYEALTSPKFQALKDKYQLDTVVKGETDEFKRQLLLRNWIRPNGGSVITMMPRSICGWIQLPL